MRLRILDFIFLCRQREPGQERERILPEDMAAWHRTDRAWLDEQIGQADRPVVVITHFLPGPASLDQRYAGSILNAYFATDCRDLMRQPVALWIHGHTHTSCDYRQGPVRVVCNPRGYSGKQGVSNDDFDSSLVIEIGTSQEIKPSTT